MSNPEIFKGSENTVDVKDAAEQRAEQLKNLEKAGEQSPDRTVEKAAARHEVEAVISKEAGKEKKSASLDSTPRDVSGANKSTKLAIYNQTMKRVRDEMGAPARTFSKIIHAPIVEKSSEVIGGSLARPNAIMAGSSTALILVLSVYVMSRTFGYQLSGFETIGAFILGWVIGLIYDYVRVMAFGRRS